MEMHIYIDVKVDIDEYQLDSMIDICAKKVEVLTINAAYSST